ncbi:MAG: murein L,D-transpeptidase catalytic domain family protein [Flavobacteriales bacterium]|nr:murein L,D-transpeptidase catalytic domain family protein [Flavobacteriales bacterium]
MLFLPIILGLFFGSPDAPLPSTPGAEKLDEVSRLHFELDLEEVLDEAVFREAWYRACERDTHPRVLAIADMTQPSSAKRLYVIDLHERRLVLRTWVAHGRGTGELMAERFSNVEGSLCTSLGLYRVGTRIISPKHGNALLLHGLEPGLNDRALQREIIMHGADYVSPEFIAQEGRLGRSWGCPAVQRKDMVVLADLLAEGDVLYIHGR